MANGSQSRKVQLTINNPLELGYDHEKIEQLLSEFPTIVYWCMADEEGLETHTPHTHIYVQFKYGVPFERIQKKFPGAHIESVRGTAVQNKEYISKTGRWKDDPKEDTSIPGTFKEWGEIPREPGQGFRSDVAELYNMIADGKSNSEIMRLKPDLAVYISHMDKIRLDILEDSYRNVRRDLTVTYIFGPTACGKTRGIMEGHGYSKVFRCTDYKHPFDRYACEPVLCFDEFRSSLMIGDMLNYLDGYPVTLPARYSNRVACYETVYIVSNIDLTAQYPNVQTDEPATWKAFLRRIHRVIEYYSDGSTVDHGSAMDYIYPPPPEWLVEAENAKQEALELPHGYDFSD